MKNNNLLNTTELHNPDIDLKLNQFAAELRELNICSCYVCYFYENHFIPFAILPSVDDVIRYLKCFNASSFGLGDYHVALYEDFKFKYNVV